MQECLLEECGRPLKSRGMCNTHYEQRRRSGALGTRLREVRKPGMTDAEVLVHIMSRSERHENGCLLWTGAKNNTGYGSLLHEGRTWVVHTLVLTITQGPRPSGKEGCHSRQCVSRVCVNPEHLRWDTRRANLVDARETKSIAHQRLARSDITAIREKHFHGIAVADIAGEFGISPHYVNKIVRGAIWSNE